MRWEPYYSPATKTVEIRHCGEQAARVGMLRPAEEVGRRSRLDHASLLQHHGLVADGAYHGQIMGHQQQREPPPPHV